MTCSSLVATLGSLQKTRMRTPGARSLLQGCNIWVKDILIICEHQLTYLQVFKAQDSQSDRRGSDGSSEKNCLILVHSVVICLAHKIKDEVLLVKENLNLMPRKCFKINAVLPVLPPGCNIFSCNHT